MDIQTTGTRIHLLGVPVDVLAPEELENRVRAMLEDGGRHQIILLSLPNLLKARRDNEFSRAVRSASLVLPTTKGIIRGARFLKLPVPHRYMVFGFVIRILGILEQFRKSVYLLGSRAQHLNVAASNLRSSFPGLNIVGRCSGYITPETEQNAILAIRKASPSLLLVGKGIKGKDRWILQHQNDFSAGMYLYAGSCFDIFSGRKRKPPREIWEKGLEWVPGLFSHPWRIFRIFTYTWYGILLIVYRLKKK